MVSFLQEIPARDRNGDIQNYVAMVTDFNTNRTLQDSVDGDKFSNGVSSDCLKGPEGSYTFGVLAQTGVNLSSPTSFLHIETSKLIFVYVFKKHWLHSKTNI